jgi:hypothetical protein
MTAQGWSSAHFASVNLFFLASDPLLMLSENQRYGPAIHECTAAPTSELACSGAVTTSTTHRRAQAAALCEPPSTAPTASVVQLSTPPMPSDPRTALMIVLQKQGGDMDTSWSFPTGAAATAGSPSLPVPVDPRAAMMAAIQRQGEADIVEPTHSVHVGPPAIDRADLLQLNHVAAGVTHTTGTAALIDSLLPDQMLGLASASVVDDIVGHESGTDVCSGCTLPLPPCVDVCGECFTRRSRDCGAAVTTRGGLGLVPWANLVNPRQIGKGSFGAVDVMVHKDLGLMVAVKRNGTKCADATAMNNEQQLYEKLLLHPHENILRVYGICNDAPDHEVRLVMKYCERGSLDTYLSGPVKSEVRHHGLPEVFGKVGLSTELESADPALCLLLFCRVACRWWLP